ncbi:MAG: hypothetical protein MUF09_09325 [Candidatus Nanopelagicales bacterium]|nr:hypothetical protein [Candidatus Nanopelagicales bacterium]
MVPLVVRIVSPSTIRVTRAVVVFPAVGTTPGGPAVAGVVTKLTVSMVVESPTSRRVVTVIAFPRWWCVSGPGVLR